MVEVMLKVKSVREPGVSNSFYLTCSCEELKRVCCVKRPSRMMFVPYRMMVLLFYRPKYTLMYYGLNV